MAKALQIALRVLIFLYTTYVALALIRKIDDEKTVTEGSRNIRIPFECCMESCDPQYVNFSAPSPDCLDVDVTRCSWGATGDVTIHGCSIYAFSIIELRLEDAGEYAVCKLNDGVCYSSVISTLHVTRITTSPPSTITTTGSTKPPVSQDLRTTTTKAKVTPTNRTTTAGKPTASPVKGPAPLTGKLVGGVVVGVIAIGGMVVVVLVVKRRRGRAYQPANQA